MVGESNHRPGASHDHPDRSTAAHCVQGTDEDEVLVRAGVTDLRNEAGQQRSVTTIVEHPRYATGVGDIAMLILDAPYDASPDIEPVAIARLRSTSSTQRSSISTVTASSRGTKSQRSERPARPNATEVARRIEAISRQRTGVGDEELRARDVIGRGAEIAARETGTADV